MTTHDEPSAAGTPIDTELVARVANELFSETPGEEHRTDRIAEDSSVLRDLELPDSLAALTGLELSGQGTEPAIAAGDPTRFYFLPTSAPSGAETESPGKFDIHSVRRDFPALHQRVNGKPLIWLDNAATTQKPQCVIDAVSNFYAHDNSNIHRGDHALSERATRAYEEAREKVRTFLGASSSSEIIFTCGTTESINLVAQSYGREHVKAGDEVLVTQLEHHSNIVPWQLLCKDVGATLRVAPIDDQGMVIPEEYEKLLGPRTKIVSIAQVSNVLGTVLPVGIMTAMAHRYGAKVLIDGAQGAPHLPTNVQVCDADFYALSGHKLFAPTGIGVLYGKKEILEEMRPWQGGGNMIESVSFEETTFAAVPAKFEAGTPHISGAIGLGAAIDYLSRLGMAAAFAYEAGLMAYATSALAGIRGLRKIGTAPNKVGALSFVIQGIDARELGRFLDAEGIAVRAGHHCAQPVHERYGVRESVRASLSLYNTMEDIDALVAVIRKAQGVL